MYYIKTQKQSPAHAELLHMKSRHEEQALEVDGCIGFEVQSIARLVIRAGDEAVELVVLLVGHLLLVHGPNRVHCVHQLAIHSHRKGNEARELFDDAIIGHFQILILSL